MIRPSSHPPPHETLGLDIFSLCRDGFFDECSNLSRIGCGVVQLSGA